MQTESSFIQLPPTTIHFNRCFLSNLG